MSITRDEAPESHNTPLQTAYAFDALVLDGRLRQSLTAVRALGRRGLRVAALATRDTLPAATLSSRWCQHKFVCPAPEGTQEYLAYLLQILQTHRPRVIIPASDGTIDLLRQHRQELEQYTKVALSQESALSIAVNKEQTLTMAQSVGIAIPKGITIHTAQEVEAALREIGLPAMMKPTESWDKGRESRQEVQLVTTLEEARHAAEQLTRMGSSVLVQQYITGGREAICLFYTQGQIIAKFAQKDKRMNPPAGGSSVLRQSIPIPADTGEQAENLIRAIDLDGYSMVEFRRDAAGVPHIMEINSRLIAGLELSVRAGIDFPFILYQWAIGASLERVEQYRTGLWMRHLGGDIASTAATIVQRGRPGIAPPMKAIGAFCATCFVPMRYDYLDGADLLPVGTAIASWFKSLPQMISSSRSRKAEQKNALHKQTL